MSNKNCTYTFLDGQGRTQTIMGLSSMKAFLVDGGLDLFYPGGRFPWLSTESAIGSVADDVSNSALKIDASAQDLDAMFDDVLAEEVAKDEAAKPEPQSKPKTSKPRSTASNPRGTAVKPQRTAGQAAASAAKSTASALANAIDGLGALFGGGGKFNSGLSFDEQTYAKAKPLFQAAIANLGEAGQDLREAMRAVVRMVLDKFGAQAAQNMKPYVVRFVSDMQNGTITGESNSNAEADNGQVGQRDPSRAPADGGERGGIRTQAPNDGAPSGALGEQQSEAVAQSQADGSGAASGSGAAPSDVSADDRAGASGDAANGRPRTGRARNPDAGAGTGAGAGKRAGGARPPAAGVTADGGGVQGQQGVSTDNPAKPGPGDYVMADPMRVVGGGQVARFNKNKAAIELRNQLIESGRKPTPEEQEILAGYTGWGSFGQDLFQGTWARPAPKQGWEERDRWLRDNLGQSEWEGMQASIINAHYTDPPTVLAMWDMVRRTGFKGGRTLEPSLGIGNFYAMMPVDMASRSQRAGIELDPMTGSMAQLLYPNANIQIKGYQDSKTPDNFYDLVIGNWPFFEHGPADRRYNRLKPTLHDYFFLKALDQTKPGGLVVGITTHGTMDKRGIGARVEMARKAELVAAFRLPTGAFEEYAGTKVVTDIIILRKRAEPLGVVANEDWIDTVEMPTPSGTPVTVNKYFQLNPQNVIGQIDFGHGTTTFAPGLIVHRPADMMEQLRRIVELTPEGAFLADTPAKTAAYLANHTGDRTGAMVYDDKGFHVVQGEYLVPISERKKYALKSDAATQAREDQFRSLIDMRRAYGRLVEAERSGNAEGERKVLRDQYEAFVGKYGPLTESYGLGYFKAIDDPFYPSLAALEVPGQQPGSFRPATILSESTTRGKTRMQNPSVRDAFVMARSESVSPSLEDIAQLAETTVEQAKAELLASGAGFELPNGDFAPADVYLSGNVREKMRQAKAALEMGNAGMEVNIQALAEVIPENIPYYKIETQMGATWVPPKTYAEYVAHMLGLGVNTDGIEVTFKAGSWKIDFPSERNYRTEANSGYGSSNVKFKRLVNAAISNQTINVKRKDSDGTEYIDTEATSEVNGKISDMRMKFGEWLWSDPVRRSELETEYNEVRNAYATPKFDGSFLGFEGMALSLGRGPFNLRQHQVNAIWRALVTRKSLNAHEVGTGKTFTMGGIAVESRRYGIAKKPILFAHNANSKSVAHEIQMMYPAAKVLYLDNLSKENVKTRMLQIANDDWDVVVMPHSLIDRIGFKKETLEAMAKEEIADLELAAQEAAEEDDAIITSEMWDDDEELKKLRSPTAKQLVKARMKIKQEIERLSQQASREDSVAFEDLGIDMVLVDEAHEFKKPPLATKMKMKGLQTATSNRSINLMFLTKYVRAMNAGGNVHLFTGTPITNTMTEVFHMMRYMMQEEMQDASLADWDGWFGSFAREVQDVELSSTGEYEVVTRLQSFINVPELRRMIGQYMDVVFADDMPEMKPRMVNGKTMASKDLTELDRAALLNGRTENAADRPYKKVVNESSDMTPEQLEVFNRVKGWAARFRSMTRKERKEAMSRGAPESPIVHDGIAAKASFDVRLVDAIGNAGKEGGQEMAPHPDSKPARVTKNLLEIYRSHGQAAQVVFMSQGMAKSVTRREGPPGNKRDVRYPAFSTMHDMIERLVQAGIPRDEIAFVDGSTSKDKRKEVADAMNSGKIRIVFGSTGSLGVGVNMQRNLRAMHHMDAPWMPGDLEQRNGRGHRQGNQWNTVLEYRYLTDRLDGRRWQVLAIKQRFITDFMKSKGDVRVIEGDATGDGDSEGGGDILATFSDAAGDPRVLLREKYKKSLDQMLARERLHGAAQVEAKRTVDAMRRDLDSYERQLSKLREAGTPQKVSDFLDSVRGDGFRLVLNGKAYTNRAEATDAVRAYVTSELRQGEDRVIGTYGDRELIAEWPRLSDQPMLMMEFDDFTAESNGASLASLDGSMRRYRDEAEAKLLDAIDISKRTAKHAKSVMDEPFHMADKLRKLEQTLSDLEADITKNPVAPPYWLRTGAPADAPVYWNDQPFIVTGHRWSDAGWFVLAADDKGDVVIPYLEAKDSQGIPVYEAREFNAPVVNTKEAPAVVPDATNSNAPAFSRAKPKASSLSAAEANSIVGAITSRWDNAPDVVVVADMQDAAVPLRVREYDAEQRSLGAQGEPEGFWFGGKVYLVAKSMGTPSDVMRVLFHEALGHYGLRGVFGDRLDAILQQIASLRRSEVEAKAKQYGLDMNIEAQRLQAAEEVLAVMAQTNPKLGFVKRAIGAIRSWLRRTMPGLFGQMELTDAEIIRDYILPARAFVERGATGVPKGGLPAMSRGTPEGRAQNKPLTEKQFYRTYYQHRMLRGPEDAEAIMRDGWQEGGIGPNVLPAYRGGEPSTILERRYMLRAGDTALLIPKEGVRDTPNGPKVKAGWKPKPYEIVQIISDGQAMYPEYMQAFKAWQESQQPAMSRSQDQTRTEAFKRWFSDSKVVDADGKPLVVYHGSPSAEINTFDAGKEGANTGAADVDHGLGGFYFTSDPNIADTYARTHEVEFANIAEQELGIKPSRSLPNSTIYPAYLSIKNPLMVDGGAITKAVIDRAQKGGHDGIIKGGTYPEYVAFRPEQIKSAIGNNGDFDPANPDIRFSRAMPAPSPQPSAWAEPGMTSFDNFVYKLQDKHIDTKRVQAAITKTAGEIEDELNAYQREELYHGRAAKRAQDFLTQELNPMVEQLAKDKIELADFEEYLHARHAPEANRVLAERNPNQDMIDAGLEAATQEIEEVELELAATTDPAEIKLLSRRMREAQAELSKWSSVQAYRGTEEDRLRLSGMSDDQARAIMDALTPEQRAKLDDAAAQFDAIVGQNRQLMVDYDLEDQETIDGWGQLFQHYVPLMREDEGNGVQQGMGTGQGFSIKGREVKSRTGSTRKVVDIVANVAMQRERIITRGEKNRVSQALMGLAALNPNPDFWKLGAPDRKRQYDPATNTVKVVTDPQYKNRENVVVTKVRNSKGRVTEVALTFEARDPRAVRMAAAIKNLEDGQLNWAMTQVAKVTRYLASVNTQYNPIFGIVNVIRDLQGAAVNLAGTPLKDSKTRVIRNAIVAIGSIYRGARKERKGGENESDWGKLWQEFQEVGGMTGFRDQFRNSQDRARAIERTMNPEKWMESAFGKIVTVGGALKTPMTWVQDGGGWVLNWLSDYNLAMENGVRLSAYKEALDKGMSREQAASLAKNLTVNFNRRGSRGMQMGAAYAFFNAAMQGTARMGQAFTTMEDGKLNTLRLSPLGKKALTGGLMMGVAQAVVLAAAGFGDDEPPEFVREKNLIIPTGWTGVGSEMGYVTIPMPLGLHVIPGLGRHMTEFAMSGGKDPAGRVISIFGMLLNAFNPIGNAGASLQSLFPTVADPLIALAENKDFTGRPIAIENRDKNIPGHKLARDTASTISKLLSEAINTLTGGNEYVSGKFSPTPDQIDYLIGQVTGGVGRELMKVEQTVSSTITGEDLPLYKVPLVGRFAGDSNGSGGQSTIYRANVNRLDRAEMEIDGLRKDGRIQESNDLRQRSDPYLLAQARAAESQVQRLRRMKRDMVDKGASRESVREVERKISEAMGRLNKAVESRAK